MTNTKSMRIFILIAAVLAASCFAAAPASAGETDNLLVFYVMGVDLEEESDRASDNMADLVKNWNPANGELLVFYGDANKAGWNDGTSIANFENLKADYETDGIFGSDNGAATQYIAGKLSGATTSGATLAEAIRYTNEYAKEHGLSNAHRYIILWDHGSGPDGLGPSDEKEISNAEIGQALSLSDKKYDMIIYDACLMANLEAAYPVRYCGTYLLGSEESMPGTGLNYEGIAKALSSGEYAALDGAKFIGDSYLSDNQEEKTFSVIDLSKIDSIVSAIDKLGDETGRYLDDENSIAALSRIYQNTEKYGSQDNPLSIDLYQFADNVYQNSGGSVHDAAGNLKSAIESAILYSKFTSGHDVANGITIAPGMAYSKPEYVDSTVVLSNGGWANFLRSFITAAQSGYEPKYSYSASTEDSDANDSGYEDTKSSTKSGTSNSPGTLTISGDNGLSEVMIDYLYLDGDKYYIVGQEYAEEIMGEAPEGSVWTSVPTGEYTTGDDWDGDWFALVNGEEITLVTMLWDGDFTEGGKEYSIYTIAGDLTRTIDGKDVTYKSLLTAFVDHEDMKVTSLTLTSDTDASSAKLNLWGSEKLAAGDRFTPVVDYLTDDDDEIHSEAGKTHTFSASPVNDLQLVEFDDETIYWDYEIDTIVEGSTPVYLSEADFAANNGTITAKPTASAAATNAAGSPLALSGVLAALGAGVFLFRRH